MRFYQQLLAAVSFGVLALSASVNAGAAPANPQAGADYRVLDQAQPTDSGGKVEVVEFFFFDCAHCASWDPSLMDWVRKQGDKISFKKVPVAFRDRFTPQQKLYYALEAMGKSDELVPKIFHAIHVQKQRINTDKTILAYIEQAGLDKQKFLDLYNSFGVQTKARRAVQLQEAYKVDGVPMIAIDGRYVTSLALVSAAQANQSGPMLQAATLQVMDHLVAKAAAEKAAGAAKKK
ncbi:thiol:disulfide interchange protein DsbA/DsbL [Herbaspirillum sp. SJZ099]|uniref:thiol:disulfide interchange protein DsbA/DsbL n=1 Tax=Herbaspirillum sp. SJZ099 TaxID=2572916 RepID=UPI0011AAD918|nr:thiol:disulfide interchange protein DsbA/DsbL [Herbaspirillum sp. SJZ099]TWC69681.1 thiol:disulfide interchange protein DsbA [Herbaspirillum sp. SJZ099]